MNSPRQFGPTSRIPWRRAVSSNCACNTAPAASISANPAVNMIALRTPSAPRSSTACNASPVGTAMMAVSGASGRSATHANAGNPWISARFGFTGNIRPWNPCCSM